MYVDAIQVMDQVNPTRFQYRYIYIRKGII